MLVLSRKAGEKLVIGDHVTVEVVRVSGNRVAIGIVAPSEVRVLRGELEDKPTRKPVAKETLVDEAFPIAG